MYNGGTLDGYKIALKKLIQISYFPPLYILNIVYILNATLNNFFCYKHLKCKRKQLLKISK